MKKSTEPLYLTAREAASELSISPATLYAYVSRGLVRSEAVEESRARRYRADDVRALKNRRTSVASSKAAEADAPVMDSAIAMITEEGPIYRGVRAVALADSATLEQCATLLWDANEADAFEPANMPVVSEAMRAVLAAAWKEVPLTRAAAVLSLASAADCRAHTRSREGRAQIAARAMRLIVAAILSVEPSAAPLHAQVARAWAPESGIAAPLIRRALVLLADHELNASTFTVRCAASTGLSLYDSVVAGMVALKGPRHGGAGPLAARMVAGLTEETMADAVRERIALGEHVPGFGHTVYADGDPRADDLLAALVASGAERWLAVDTPRLIAEASGLQPNIDFALAVMTRTLGLSIGHETALFAMARAAGWLAHAIEQLETGALIRPRARYVGPTPGRRAAE